MKDNSTAASTVVLTVGWLAALMDATMVVKSVSQTAEEKDVLMAVLTAVWLAHYLVENLVDMMEPLKVASMVELMDVMKVDMLAVSRAVWKVLLMA